ncbi:NAD-dependent malic enzyme [Klebsiella pneumoniae]|nr:NAD-dependent malic enzyme [Klebsiella pneumoniae]
MQVGDKRIPIAQCNNAYIFPGIGLGVIAARANRVTEGMLMAAANALANCSPIVTRGEGAVLPALGDIREVSKRIAVAVAKQAQAEGKALHTSDEVLNDAIEANFWLSRYRAYRRTSF